MCIYLHRTRYSEISRHKTFYSSMLQIQKNLIQEKLILILDKMKSKARRVRVRRVRQIWNSELYTRNKVLAHNIFAIPVLTTSSVYQKGQQELEDLNIKTRKILTACAIFHINTDTDRLCCYRKHGGRELNGISDTYVTRILTLTLHLKYPPLENQFLQHVVSHESEGLIRATENLMENFNIDTNNLDHNAKTTNLSVKRKSGETTQRNGLMKNNMDT